MKMEKDRIKVAFQCRLPMAVKRHLFIVAAEQRRTANTVVEDALKLYFKHINSRLSS